MMHGSARRRRGEREGHENRKGAEGDSSTSATMGHGRLLPGSLAAPLFRSRRGGLPEFKVSGR